MNEYKLLSAIVYDRGCYERLKNLLKEEDFSDKGKIIYREVTNQYTNDPDSESVDKEILHEKFQYEYPKHYELFRQILDRLEPVSVPNVIELFIGFKKKQIETKIAHAFLGEDENLKHQLLEEYDEIDNLKEDNLDEEPVHQGTSIHEISQTFDPNNLIKIYPRIINDIVGGGVPPQSHILIYAYTEVGKSLWGINMACGFLYTGRKVLYIGNEDPTDLMLMRFCSRLTGMPRYDILKDMDYADKKARENGYENLVFAPASPGTISEIEQMVKEYDPDVLVVDQLINLHIKKTSKVELLEHAAKEIRTLCKKYGVVAISLAQGADSAENKRFLDKSDVYYSNVGVQGQTDIMIGVGMDDEYEEQNRRGVSICKNKITGRHDRISVTVDPQISKVIS